MPVHARELLAELTAAYFHYTRHTGPPLINRAPSACLPSLLDHPQSQDFRVFFASRRPALYHPWFTQFFKTNVAGLRAGAELKKNELIRTFTFFFVQFELKLKDARLALS
jgi:hypothetical protein